MGRVRVIGLVVLAAFAVVAFVAAPETGRYSQVTWLLLIAVLGLLWHLALSEGGIRRTSAVPTPAIATPAAPAPPPGPTTRPPARATTVADDEDLSLLPDPPANWPPPGVQVPLVFRSPEPALQHEPDRAALDTTAAGAGAGAPVDEAVVIDLTDDDVAERSPTDAVPVGSVPTGAVPAGSSGDDPWLAFAASMLASKD